MTQEETRAQLKWLIEENNRAIAEKNRLKTLSVKEDEKIQRTAPKLTAEEFKEKFLDWFKDEYEELCGDYGDDACYAGALREKLYEDPIKTDLAKVDFDFENIDDDDIYNYKGICGLRSIRDLQYYGMWAGGDWEYPVFFIIYWDGKDFRAYLPVNGNVFNKKNMIAYGNEEDEEECSEDEEDNYKKYDNEYNQEEITKEIIEKIIVT